MCSTTVGAKRRRRDVDGPLFLLSLFRTLFIVDRDDQINRMCISLSLSLSRSLARSVKVRVDFAFRVPSLVSYSYQRRSAITRRRSGQPRGHAQ